MAAGRKPPIIPPCNRLAGQTGKRPPLPFYVALMKMRDRQRLEITQGRSLRILSLAGADKAQLLPSDPQAAARHAMTGLDPVAEKGRLKAAYAIRRARERAAEAEKQAAALETLRLLENGAPQPRSTRPPTPQPGRYDGLKEPG